MTIEEIFLAAVELAPAERAAYLEAACGGNAGLRVRVEALLRSHEEAGSLLEQPLFSISTAPTVGQEPSAVGPGAMVGPYKLLEVIDEGGMGTVYLAEQTVPVRRTVALKVIKAGMDTRQVLARFEAERQTLALMDHPNIARVLDAGATDRGRPYFVMELVKGVPITRFCDERRLSPRERLELFVAVCQAVQHAHQKGVIHRDIKPTNVLVALYDGKPVPKVIDFGVAKATGPRLTDATLFTGFGAVVGTPEYMSPEQAELNQLDVDTRSDIYSLGVLLYELLTGTTPLQSHRVREAAVFEVLRLVREQEPDRPSHRLSSTEELPSIAAHRSVEPRRLPGLVRGDLDWIAMKALAKERNRRYETAGSFAADVNRYLRDEPVLACPPSARYRFRKFSRRHRVALTAGTGVASAVLATLIILAVSNVVIRQEQERTRGEKNRAERAQQLAEDSAREVHQGLERLQRANTLVESARGYNNWKRWNDAHAALTQAIELRPDHAPAREERGDLYARLGLWELAAADMGKAFELQEPAHAWRWLALALLRDHVGDQAGCREVGERMDERFHGTTDSFFTADLVRVRALVPDPSGDPARWVELGRAIVASPDPGLPWFYYALGAAHYRAGQYEPAIQRFRESLDNPDWNARSINYPLLAMAYHRLGRQDEARQALDEAARAIDGWTEAMYASAADGNWVNHQGATGFCPISWWDWVDCQVRYREARTLMGLPPPPEDPRLRVLRARAFAGLRWSNRAVAEYAAALELSPSDPRIRLEAHRARAFDHTTRGRWKEAAAEYALASELQPEEAYFWWYQAVTRLAAGDVEAYQRVCADMLKRFGATRDQRTAWVVVAACVLRPDALADQARLVPVGRVAARGHPGANRILAAALHRAGADDEAARCFQEAAQVYRFRAGDWLFLAMIHHRLGQDGEARRCLDRGIQWMREADSRTLGDLAGTQPAWGGWHERVTVPLLLREAEALITETNASPPPNGR